MAENKIAKVESLLRWLASGEKDEDGNWLSDDDTQLVCDTLEYYLNMHGQKNKMAQVAEMFGKKLGEEFVIYTQEKERITISIQQDGVYTRDGKRTFWVLERLLTGEVKIVEDEK